ncbi:hypothetical protein [Chryseobacterium sp. EO14]|uniref:hypothetical protein n=1 Tax=Chryseobacterium sp. EO14 TaxID=2950551 RepID=UPI00210D663B|nr:hypothetical protein [Chryseobacterium sp. EO14]MCQ4139218.1 hypothetical protein [Chryseobacterium sp. EO14]
MENKDYIEESGYIDPKAFDNLLSNKNTIKPEDLRIGNLVSRRDIGDDSERIEVIIELKKDKALTSGPIAVLCSYEDLQPIPLTEEWLLKLGFQKEDQGSVSAQFHYGENPVTKDYLISLIWIKDYKSNNNALEGFPFYKNGHFTIKTVYQLQNLFHAMTGEELKLK